MYIYYHDNNNKVWIVFGTSVMYAFVVFIKVSLNIYNLLSLRVIRVCLCNNIVTQHLKGQNILYTVIRIIIICALFNLKYKTKLYN